MSQFNYSPNQWRGFQLNKFDPSLQGLLAPWQTTTMSNQQGIDMASMFGNLFNFQGQGYDQAFKELRKSGNQQRGDIRRAGRGERNTIATSLAGRGLANTTTLDSLQKGSRESQTRNVARVTENQGRLRSGLRERQTAAQGSTLRGNIGAQQQIYQQLFQMMMQWERQRSENTNTGFGASFKNAFGGGLGQGAAAGVFGGMNNLFG